MEAITHTMDLPVGRDALWPLCASPSGLSRWLCDAVEAESEAGHQMRLVWEGPPRRVVQVRVAFTDRPRLIRAEWRPLHPGAGGRPLAGEPGSTPVVLELRPTPRGTRLHLRHGPWPEGEAWFHEREAAAVAWEHALERLRGAARRADRGR